MRPKKVEIVIGLLLTIVLGIFIASQYVSLQPLGSYAFNNSLPQSARNTYGNEDGAPATDSRVKDIRQTIVGNLEKGTFEPCVLGIHDLVDAYEGYIYTETLTYKEEVWSGEVVTRIPQENATEFVFDVRQLITDNGKVVSIQTVVTDITGEIGQNETLPPASIKIVLEETYGVPMAWSNIPIIGGAIPILASTFTIVGIGLVVATPSFFVLLGIVMLSNRVLRPLAVRIWKQHPIEKEKVEKMKTLPPLPQDEKSVRL